MTYTARSNRSDKFERHFISHDRVLLVTHEDATKELGFKVYLLTSTRQAGPQTRIFFGKRELLSEFRKAHLYP